jgi:hypothetical protein
MLTWKHLIRAGVSLAVLVTLAGVAAWLVCQEAGCGRKYPIVDGHPGDADSRRGQVGEHNRRRPACAAAQLMTECVRLEEGDLRDCLANVPDLPRPAAR